MIDTQIRPLMMLSILESMSDGKEVTKGSINEQAETFAFNSIEGGYALSTLVAVKAAQEYLGTIEKDVRPAALTEAEALTPEQRVIAGAKVSVRNLPSTYDYEADLTYRQLQATLAEAKAELDKRKKYLDLALESPSGVFVGDGGELITAPALVKEGGKTLAITIPAK